jgi:hypothetical protein
VNFALDLAAERLVTVLDDWAPPPIDRFFLYYPSIHQHDVPSVEPKQLRVLHEADCDDQVVGGDMVKW